MIMNEKEYDEKFKEYLKEKGPNPGTTFFGSWGWYATMKNQFDREQNGQNGSEERVQN
jgi:hypothetical protein